MGSCAAPSAKGDDKFITTDYLQQCRHSYIMHMLYHRQPRKVIQALAGHRDPRSMEVYTRVFALDMAATLAVPFTGDGRDAAEILRTLPPLK